MKQILRTLTKLLYMDLNDCAWKITRISIENQCRIIAYFAPKKKRMLQLACDEIAQSKDGELQRGVIRKIATLASRDDEQAQALLEELPATHKPNAELIALVKLFKSAWQHTRFHKAASHLQGFASVAMRSKINAVRNFGRRIAKEADYIAHAIVLKLTNGAIESFNRKIADLLRRGYGYKNPSYFF